MKGMEITGIILAGGESRRMGRDKAELRLGGKTLAEIQLEKLQALGIGDILLSGDKRALPGTRRVTDVYPGRGPLSGIHACLKAAGNPVCLVLSVDVPLFPGETLGELAAAHEGGATVLGYAGEIEPLIAVYDSDLADTAEELLLADRRSVRNLLKSTKTKVFPFAGVPEALLNCNTPEEFARAEALWGK